MRKLILAICTLWLAAGLLSAGATTPQLNLARYHGKVVYRDFWASWGPPCRHSFPWMNAMQQKYGKQGLPIVAVNGEEQLAEKYNLLGMPSSFLISRKGRIIWRHKGFHNDARPDYEAKIRAALAKSDSSGVAK